MKYYLTAIVFFLSSFSGFSQGYQPFPTSNAYWIYVVNTGNWGNTLPFSPSLIYRQFMLNGADTIINGYTYKIVIQREYIDSTLYFNNPIPDYTNKIANVPDEIVMAIREDNKKILALLFPSTTEVLLYDFNKNIGDTMRYLPSSNSKVITGSDVVTIGANSHKRWLTDSYMTDVIEGVGSIQGIFGMTNGQNTVQLACFFSTGQGSYSYGDATCFYIHKYGTPTSVTDLTEGTDILIAPNPFTDKIQITSTTAVAVTIYNSVGQRILSEPYVTSKSINTSALPGGMYFMELVNDAGVRKQVKLLKQ